MPAKAHAPRQAAQAPHPAHEERRGPRGIAGQPVTLGLHFGYAPAGPAGVSPAHVQRLQRYAGNAAASRYLMRHSTAHPLVQRWKPWGKKAGAAAPPKPAIEKHKRLRGVKQGGNTSLDADDLTGVDTIGSGVSGALGYGAELTGAPGESMANYAGETTRLGDKANWDEEQGTGDKPLRFMGPTGQDRLGAAGAGVGALGAGLGAVGGLGGAALGVYSLVKTIKSVEPADGWEVAKIVTSILSGANSAVFSGGQALGGATQSIAQGIASTGSSAASTAADVAGGITESLGGLGGMVEAFLGVVSGVIGAGQYFSGIARKGWRQTDLLVSIGGDFLRALKGFFVAAKSLLSAASTFVSLASVGGEFVQVFPVVGAALNIVVQLIDMLVQGIELARRVYKLVRGAINASKMKKLAAASTGGVKDFAEHLVDINKKRWQRTIVPIIASCMTMFANVLSISGSVLNIVGAATAAAYGAGVGIMAGGYAAAGASTITKVAAAGLKGGQGAFRWAKQEFRDLGKGNQQGRIYKAGAAVGINMEKTSTAKAKTMGDQIAFIIRHLGSLPDPVPDKAADPAGFEAARLQYEQAHLMVKASGASVKELTSARSADEVVNLFKAALAARE